ncbi:MAG: transglutaminase-like cysteine peptidase [Deltaproteobacteria bacterium]|nr:transglutaminase-like cysteine peptidase [Deltaproteobacteria bacterium]
MDTAPAAVQRLRLICILCLLACASLPVLPARAAEQEAFERLFGYQAFPAGTQDFPVYIRIHWHRVLQAEQHNPCLQRNASCLPQTDAPQWLYLARKAPAMDEMELLRTVNAFFNKFPSAPDIKNYGVGDHWPTLAEFFSRRSGDCKAYTLSKYFALRALGMRDDKLRIVLVHLPERKENHAMLAVATARGVFILDNNVRPKDLILPQEHFASRCIPLFMLNETGRWTFRQNRALLRAPKAGS